MFLGIEHGGYIFVSYLFTVLTFAGLIFSVWMNLNRQKKKLAALEASGAKRRRAKGKRPSTRAAKNG